MQGTIPDDFESLKSFVSTLFETMPGKLMVANDLQEKEINLLRQTIGSGRFFFVVDLVNFEISASAGIQRWLGYNEKEFSLKQYWNIIHPGRQVGLMAVALQLYSILCSGHYKLDYLVQRYSGKVALRHYSGEYLLFQKISSVFQFDEKNRLTAYMNEFTRLGKYKNQPLEPEFYTSSGEEEGERGKAILRKTIDQFMSMNIFSYQELQVARIIAYYPQTKQTEVAEQLEISPHTVDTYCKRFLTKARDHFKIEFSSVLAAADFLKREGLI